MKYQSKAVQWIGTFFFAGGGLVIAFNGFRGGFTDGTVPGLIGAAITLYAMFVAYYWVDVKRMKALRSAHPQAFIARLAPYPELREQVKQLATQLSIPAGVPAGAVRLIEYDYLTVVIDGATFEIYGGIFRPRLKFRAAHAKIEVAEIAKRRQGQWSLECIHLVFGDSPANSTDLDLCLVHQRIMFVKKGPALQEALSELESVLGSRPERIAD